MAKSNLYTRTGDGGTTSLVGGQREKKNSIRLEAYGTLDEFSAFLGSIAADTYCPDEIKSQLLDIQNLLFDFGAYLATDPGSGKQLYIDTLTDEHILKLEGWIDTLDEQTPTIRAFVLPGGSEISAKAHIARTVCRRAERRIISLADISFVDPKLIGYMNRLSDYLFILSRYFNHIKGCKEITWKKV